ncbi:MAG TPA: glycosyltransferase [Gammaproteobacteria bacterium]|nr:glycosyltransferase [Gammaproteobacteria bacterium]
MENRKNILILMHNDATQFIDVANQYTKLFDRDKYKVTVAYLASEANENTKNKMLSEEVLFLNLPKNHFRGLKINLIKNLTLLCRKEQFELVIAHRYKPIYTMMCVSLFCKIPAMVFVMHAMETLDNISRKWFIALLLKKNMCFAGVSDAVRDDMRKQIWRAPKERVITLYNCMDMSLSEKNLLSRDAARKALNIPSAVFAMSNIGRLVPDKDQKTLLYAFASAKARLPRTILYMMGDGVLLEELKQLTAKLHLENDVVFTGFVPDAQRYLKAFDLFVLSSVEEAFGRVLTEAMIARVPVIGTRINGIPEVIGDAGVIVDARDSHLLAEALISMANLPTQELAAWGEKGYERVKKHFSTDKFREDFWAEIQTLVPNAS